MPVILPTEVRLNIILHENQKLVHSSTAKYKTIKAGKRFGKTKWAIFEIAQRAGETPGGLFWYTAPFYRQAKEIAWTGLKWMIPGQIVKRYYDSDLVVEFKNQARIQLKGEDNPDSLRGIEIDGLVRDEVALNRDGLEIWQTVLRGQLNPRGHFAYHISSPNPTGRNWYTNFFEDHKAKMLSGDANYYARHFTIYDNPTMPRAEIESIKEGMPEDAWNLNYMAIESLHAGQLYAEFSNDLNIGEYEGSRFLTRVFRGLDWGLDHPTVCLWAKLDESKGILYVYDEYVKSGMTISENCKVIKDKSGMVPIEWSVIDPSSKRRDPQTLRSVADEFARYGLTCIQGDNRERGRDIVKMFLKTGRVKISPRCKNLIYELRNLQWGDKVGDDCTDALRYLLVRVHDSIIGMNVLFEEAKIYQTSNPRECNINDPIFKTLGGSSNDENMSWVFEEVE